MTHIPRRVIVMAALAGALLLTVNIWLWPNYNLQVSRTSFGIYSDGYKAGYLLLSELGLRVSRSYLAPGKVAAGRMLWLVSPFFLDPHDPSGDSEAKELVESVRSGRTAIVFGDDQSDWKRLGIKRTTSPLGDTAAISGDWVRMPRTVVLAGLLHFGGADDHARVRLRSDSAPFAVELQIGTGRLIAVADDRFFRNTNLAEGDASVLLVDLALALGPPVFDERCHGLAAPVSIVAAIAHSRAVLPLLIGLAASVLWAAEQHSWPRRTLPEQADDVAPSLVAFVESLGTLYSRVPDPQAAFGAYRAGFLRRLRRQLSPHAELPERLLLERIARDHSIPDETRRWLAEDALPRSESELVSAVRAIESYPRVRA